MLPKKDDENGKKCIIYRRDKRGETNNKIFVNCNYY